jgi:hypothetical protein
VLLTQVRSLTSFVERELKEELEKPPLSTRFATLKQILAQDLEPDPEGGGSRIKQGVARDRRISVRDGDIENTAILGATITPANRPRHPLDHPCLESL